MAVKTFHENHELLAQYKKIARKNAEQFYSRKNTELFVKALEANINVKYFALIVKL